MAGPNQVPGPTAIRAPTRDLSNHQIILTQLKETTETAQRIRGNPNDSYVKLGELVNAGVIKYIGGIVSPNNSNVHVKDSITGAGTTANPLELSGDVTAPGNNMYYGTNGSGARGWYASSGGGSSLTITDGTNTVTGVTHLAVTGGTVGGSTPNATLTISGGGGGGGPFNVTPDTHTATPTFVANDEFEGTSLDTTGTRFAGATAWTWVNQGGASIAFSMGAVKMSGTVNDFNIRGIFQPTPNLTAWRYRIKQRLVYGASGQVNSGFMCGETSSGKFMGAGMITNGVGTNYFWTPYWTNSTTFNNYTNLTGPTTSPDVIEPTFQQFAYMYHELELASGSITYRISKNGDDGSFITIGSLPLATPGISQLDTIGIYVDSQANGSTPISFTDWFRRMA